MEWASMIETALGVILGAIVSILSIALNDRIKDQVSSRKAKNRLYDELKLIQEALNVSLSSSNSCLSHIYMSKNEERISTPLDFDMDLSILDDYVSTCSHTLSFNQRYQINQLKSQIGRLNPYYKKIDRIMLSFEEHDDYEKKLEDFEEAMLLITNFSLVCSNEKNRIKLIIEDKKFDEELYSDYEKIRIAAGKQEANND